MKNLIFAFVVGALGMGGYAYTELQKERSAKEILIQENTGYVKYKDYLSEGKAQISEKENSSALKLNGKIRIQEK